VVKAVVAILWWHLVYEAPQPGNHEARLLQQRRFAELDGAARLRLAVASRRKGIATVSLGGYTNAEPFAA